MRAAGPPPRPCLPPCSLALVRGMHCPTSGYALVPRLNRRQQSKDIEVDLWRFVVPPGPGADEEEEGEEEEEEEEGELQQRTRQRQRQRQQQQQRQGSEEGTSDEEEEDG